MLLQRGLIGFDEGIEPDADAAVGKRDDRGIAHLRVLPDQLDQNGRVVDQAPSAAFAVGEIEQAAGDGLVDLLAGLEPDARHHRLAREYLSLLRRQRLGRVAALVFQEMPQILIGRDTEQPAAALEAGGELEIGEIGAAVAAAQPVLLLGQIVVTDAGTMQFSQRRLGGRK